VLVDHLQDVLVLQTVGSKGVVGVAEGGLQLRECVRGLGEMGVCDEREVH
jgi:hypothetical protein